MIIAYIILGLLLVYLTKRSLTQTLGRLVHRLGGGQRGTIVLWSVIFLPGTVIHEISHFFFAIFTGARTGRIEIFPEYLDDEFAHEGERGVTLGYVQTSQLNPLQGFLVGFAPFLVGSSLLVWFSILLNNAYHQNQYYLLALYLYLFFTVANSFFPSWADIKQTLTFIILLIITLVLLWFFNFRFFAFENLPFADQLLTLTQTLFLAASLNLLIVIFLRGIIYLWPKPKKFYHQNR